MKSLLITFLVLFALNVEAQEQPRNRISLMAGFGGGQWKDQFYSPLRYDVSSALWQLGWERYTRRGHIFILETQSIAATLTPDAYDTFESDMFAFELQTAWLWKLKETTRWQFYVGPEYSISSQVSTWEDGYDLSSAYTYLSTNGLSLTGRARYQLNRWNLNGQVSLPVLMYTSRPPYAGNTDITGSSELLFRVKDGDWQSLDSYLAPEVRLQAEYELRSWIGLAAQYRFAYQDLEADQPMSYSFHKIQIGVNFKF